MSRTVVVGLVAILGCDGNSSRQPKVETEKAVRGAELEKRKAYSSDARTSVPMIISDAEQLDLCAEFGDGAVGPTPSIDVDCNAAPDGMCAPVEGPTNAWEYPRALWEEGVWKKIGYRRHGPHHYHYSLEWKTLENGECENRARVFGDLDGDGIFSTYEGVAKLPGPPEWNGEMRKVKNPLE